MNVGSLSYVCQFWNKSLLVKRTITALHPGQGSVAFITTIMMLNARTMLCRTFPDHDLIEHKNTVFAWENIDWMAKRYCYNPENLGSIQQKDAMLCLHPENGTLVFKVWCVGTSSDMHPAFLFELQRLFCLLAGWLSRLIFQWLQSPAGSWFTYINAEFCGTAKAYEVKDHFGEPQCS